MRNTRLIVLLISLTLILGLGVAYLLGQPRLVEVSPAPDQKNVRAGNPLRLTFSRTMQPDSVTERLVTEPPQSGDFTWEDNTLIFTPDKPWPSGEKVNVRLSPGARTAGFVPLSLRQERTWSFTIGNPLLAYLYPSDRSADIYTIDPRTGEIERLADSPGGVLDFDVNFPGTTIYYNTSQGGGGSAIHRLDRLTGQVELILKCPLALCRYPQVSPDGEYLAYERTALNRDDPYDYPQVWLMPLTGEETATDKPSTPSGDPFLAGHPDHRTEQPRWSSTGLLAYYDYNLSVFIIQDPESGVSQFPSQTGLAGTWEPGGQSYVIPEIFFNIINDPDILTELDPRPSSHLLRFNYQDGSTLDLTVADNLEDTSPVYAPDGKTLAFARKYLDIARWTPGRQLWLMNADGSDARPLTQEAHYTHYDFAWSPGGDQLAYVRFNQTLLTEPPEIWVINSDGTQATLLIVGGYAPQWIP